MFDREGKKVQTVTSEKFSRPTGVAVDKDDNIYVFDYGNSTLFKFGKKGKLIRKVRKRGTRPGEFSSLSLIKVINDELYVCDGGNHRVQILNTKLDYINSFGCCGDGDGQFRGQATLPRTEQGIYM